MKPVAYMADGEVFLDQRCITLEKPTELYTADQLRQAKVKVLREAAEIIKEYGLVAFGNGSAHYNEGINYGANECVRIAQDLEDGK